MTPIQGISGIDGNLLSKNTQVSKLTGSESFQDALNAVKSLIDKNVMAEKVVSQKTTEFMTGENDNVVDLMVAASKSSILMQYSLQVRNNLMNAYKEILNITV